MSHDEGLSSGGKFDLPLAENLSWHKSTRSETKQCVEVAIQPDLVFVRDSEEPDGAWLRFTPAQWQCFLDGAVQGEFDL
jgi:hypothetical protein